MKKPLLLALSSLYCLFLLAQDKAVQQGTLPTQLPHTLHAPSSLALRLDSLVKHRLPQGSATGICVYDLSAAKTLYAYRADKLSRPASTLKLLTAIATLAHEQGDEPFRTTLWHTGTIEKDTLRGDLYVVGGYDPEFNDEALDSLVRAVSRLPISVVQGKIYGDVSMKDSLYWGSGWAWDDTPEAYQPYLSPLMLNKGVLTVTALPTQRGNPAQLKCTPASTYYTLTNQTKSHATTAERFRVSRNWLTNGNNVIVTGSVNTRQTGTVNLYSSQDFFMYTFVERLQARGIGCDTRYAFGELPKEALRVATYATSLQKVLNQLMKESDNLNAEALLCRLGAQVSGKKYITAEDGLSAIRLLIKEMGYRPDSYKVQDGSGLSNYNYISPELLVAFLNYAYARTDIFRKLYKALPTGGVDGTLKYRMQRGTLSYKKVHAKTGSFTGINCLAGYVEVGEGRHLAFAIMNQNVLSAAQARAFQDAVCDELIRSGGH